MRPRQEPDDFSPSAGVSGFGKSASSTSPRIFAAYRTGSYHGTLLALWTRSCPCGLLRAPAASTAACVLSLHTILTITRPSRRCDITKWFQSMREPTAGCEISHNLFQMRPEQISRHELRRARLSSLSRTRVCFINIRMNTALIRGHVCTPL